MWSVGLPVPLRDLHRLIGVLGRTPVGSATHPYPFLPSAGIAGGVDPIEDPEACSVPGCRNLLNHLGLNPTPGVIPRTAGCYS